jgi:hypothetical protein
MGQEYNINEVVSRINIPVTEDTQMRAMQSSQTEVQSFGQHSK